MMMMMMIEVFFLSALASLILEHKPLRQGVLILKGSGSTQPEVKSVPESTRPLVNSARCIFRALVTYSLYDICF